MAITNKTNSPISSTTYDWLKQIAQIILPALGTAYFGVAEIWHLPFGPEVVGTITVIDLFLGVVLGVLAKQYYNNGANFDGELTMVPGEDGRDKVVFDVQSDPETVVKQFGKRTFEFKVTRQSASPSGNLGKGRPADMPTQGFSDGSGQTKGV